MATGGASFGGAGGAGGAGGGLLNSGGMVTIADSVFKTNHSGAGGAGGAGLRGGNGGAGGGSSGSGGKGGDCFAGSGGSGGDGGAIAIEDGKAEISRTAIEGNVAGDGGASAGCQAGGDGGAGSENGNGGAGGFDFAGSGGSGGYGGGVIQKGGTVVIVGSTIAGNEAGAGSEGAPGGTAGSGGAGGSGTGSGASGSFSDGGSGGSGGSGGGMAAFSGASGGNTKLVGDAFIANTAGDATQGGAGGQGGNGGGNGGGGGTAGGAGSSSGGFGGEGGGGGGLYLDLAGSVLNVTLTGNSTGSGGVGGSGGSGPATSIGSIGGEGGFGGGILFSGIAVASHVTAISNSTAPGGAAGAAGSGSPALVGLPGSAGAGGDLNSFGFGTPNTTLNASIVANCGGDIADGGGNLTPASLGGCPGIAADPGLGPLADNGGPTKTMALHPGSAAVDAVKAPCGTEPDQRGVARPQGAGCDAGAYELAPPSIATGKPSRISGRAARVSGQINPNARATTWHVEYGTSTAYGARTSDQALPPGLEPVAVSASLKKLKPGKTVHYRLVATNADGTKTSPDATLFGGVKILTGKAGVGPGGQVAVRIVCAKGAAGACAGALSIRAGTGGKKARLRRKAAKPKQLAHAGFKLAGGAHRSVSLQLSKQALATVHRAGNPGLKVTVLANAHDGSGQRAITTRAVRLKPSR